MSSRPELKAPPEIFYDEEEARKYTSSSRIIKIQSELTERAVELLALPEDGIPRLLLDIGCGSGLSGEVLSEIGHEWIGLDISASMLNVALEREVEGDLLLGDMGQGLGFRPGVLDGAISISAVQDGLGNHRPVFYWEWGRDGIGIFFPIPWLCNADKSSHEPPLRLKAFFGSLYRCLARGARAVFQVYPENVDQRVLILNSAMRAGFSGGVVVDFPHSSKKRKEYLVLTCGPSVDTFVPNGKTEDDECYTDDDSSEEEEEETPTVCVSERHRPRKKQKTTKKVKGRDWVMRRKKVRRSRGQDVPRDSKYTARKRKSRF